MNEALCSILCGEKEWRYCDQVRRLIKFNKDGTGELWCCIEMCYFIVAELEWKSLSSPQPDQVETTGPTGPRRPQLLGQLNLEITLSKKVAKELLTSKSSLPMTINEIFLLDNAFRPKVFTVRIEKGNFIAPSGIGFKDSPRERYVLRLLFDKSPYPPQEEWKRPEGGPDSNLFWDNVEFAGRPSPELQKKRRIAMNDVDSAGWGSCVVT